MDAKTVNASVLHVAVIAVNAQLDVREELSRHILGSEVLKRFSVLAVGEVAEVKPFFLHHLKRPEAVDGEVLRGAVDVSRRGQHLRDVFQGEAAHAHGTRELNDDVALGPLEGVALARVAIRLNDRAGSVRGVTVKRVTEQSQFRLVALRGEEMVLRRLDSITYILNGTKLLC